MPDPITDPPVDRRCPRFAAWPATAVPVVVHPRLPIRLRHARTRPQNS